VPGGYRHVADYGHWQLFDGDVATLPAKSWVLGDTHSLKFDRLQIDTRLPEIAAPAGFSLKSPDGPALQIVQFVGPIKDAWLEQLRATGGRPIQYVDSDGYLVWADAAARLKLDGMVNAGQVLQFNKPLPGFIKLGNSLFNRLQRGASNGGKSSIIVQRYRYDGDAGRAQFSSLALKPVDDWMPQLGYEIARFEASDEQIRQLMDLPEPDSPVITIRLSRGRSISMFLRLCVRAPRMRIVSIGMIRLKFNTGECGTRIRCGAPRAVDVVAGCRSSRFSRQIRERTVS
jgi:hypothetical protein